mmetsp:Transcript_23720/g.56173  ORF Transcript_23720/g.56173 Transcript_23720/m.56173 type:complete len:231 (-) Transcript_23720:1340-2032(-)
MAALRRRLTGVDLVEMLRRSTRNDPSAEASASVDASAASASPSSRDGSPSSSSDVRLTLSDRPGSDMAVSLSIPAPAPPARPAAGARSGPPAGGKTSGNSASPSSSLLRLIAESPAGSRSGTSCSRDDALASMASWLADGSTRVSCDLLPSEMEWRRSSRPSPPGRKSVRSAPREFLRPPSASLSSPAAAFFFPRLRLLCFLTMSSTPRATSLSRSPRIASGRVCSNSVG